MRMSRLGIEKYKPRFAPVEFFITRFFVGEELLFEQETKVPLPDLVVGDVIAIFDVDYIIHNRTFGFNEDAFIVVYLLDKLL